MIDLNSLEAQIKSNIIKAELVDVSDAGLCTIKFVGVQIADVPIDMQLISSNSAEAIYLRDWYYVKPSAKLYLKANIGKQVYVHCGHVDVSSLDAKLTNPTVVGLVDQYPVFQLAVHVNSDDSYYTAGRLTTLENAAKTDINPLLTDDYSYIMPQNVFSENLSHVYNEDPTPEIDILQNDVIDSIYRLSREGYYEQNSYEYTPYFYQWIEVPEGGGTAANVYSQSDMIPSRSGEVLLGTGTMFLDASYEGYISSTNYWPAYRYSVNSSPVIYGDFFCEYDFLDKLSICGKLGFCLFISENIPSGDNEDFNYLYKQYKDIISKIHGSGSIEPWEYITGVQVYGEYASELGGYIGEVCYLYEEITFDDAVSHVILGPQGVTPQSLEIEIDALFKSFLDLLSPENFKQYLINAGATEYAGFSYYPVLIDDIANQASPTGVKYPYFIRKKYTKTDILGNSYVSYIVYNAIPVISVANNNGIITRNIGLAGTMHGRFGTDVSTNITTTDKYYISNETFTVYSNFINPYQPTLLTSYSIISHSICGTLIDTRDGSGGPVETAFLKFDDDVRYLYLSRTNDGQNMTVIWIDSNYTIKSFSLPLGFLALIAPFEFYED